MEGGTGRPRKRHDFLICAPSPEAPRGSEVDRLLAENARLRAELVQARADAAARQVKVDRLQARVGELEVALEEARRAAKRQAAPFSRNRPKARPRPGGRKPGAAYGAKAHRLAPAPERVDEVVAVALPGCCPHCGGEVVVDTVAWQFQEELVCVRARMRRYDLQLGHCTACMRAVRGRHPEQTSQALGAAGTMLGPRAIAVAAWLHVGLGVPVAKVAMILKELGGISLTPGGLQQALHRLAGHAGSTQQALLGTLRGSAAVSADETGWRVAGRKAWLWAYVGDHASVYDIAGGCGYDQAAAILGGDFAGVLERDGWAPYRRFEQASHQSCLAHLLRRATGMIQDAVAGQAKVPHALRRILKDAWPSATPAWKGRFWPGRSPAWRSGWRPSAGAPRAMSPTDGWWLMCAGRPRTCSRS